MRKGEMVSYHDWRKYRLDNNMSDSFLDMQESSVSECSNCGDISICEQGVVVVPGMGAFPVCDKCKDVVGESPEAYLIKWEMEDSA